MDVSGDAGAGGFADVHTEVDAVGVVEFAQDRLHALRELHHFIRGFRWEFLQLVEMRVGHNHYVAGRVGKRIQDDEAMLAAMHDAGFGVVARINRVTENAARCLLSGRDIGIAPRGPEVIHSKGRVADSGRPRVHLADLLLDFHLHGFPPPLMAFALRLELRIAAGMEGPLGDGET